MRKRWFRRLLYHALTAAQWTAVVISGAVSASLRAKVTDLHGTWASFAPLLDWVQDRAWLILLVVPVCIAIVEFLRRFTGPPWVWDAIHHHLDLFQEYAFPDQSGDMLHNHRVTLFKYVSWRWCWSKWPWSGWLIPFERSGHTTQHSSARFRVPDDAERIEGVAGATWASRGAVVVTDLPDLQNQPSEGDIRTYAQRTYVTEEWLRVYINKRRPLARSFVGIPVNVKGNRWGVIVLDSRGEMLVGPTILKLYTLISRIFGKLLERA